MSEVSSDPRKAVNLCSVGRFRLILAVVAFGISATQIAPFPGGCCGSEVRRGFHRRGLAFFCLLALAGWGIGPARLVNTD